MCVEWVLISHGDGVCVGWLLIGNEDVGMCWTVTGSSHGNPIARPVANQIIRNGVSHDEAMLAVRCLLFLRASNAFHTFRETVGQEQQLAASS